MEKEMGELSQAERVVCTNAWRHGRMWHGTFGERQKIQSGEKGGEIGWGKEAGTQSLSACIL